MRVELCRLCGFTIIAPRDDEDAIFVAVFRHNLSDAHVLARLGMRR